MSKSTKRAVIKREKNFILYEDGTFRIDNVVLAYPDSLLKAKPVMDSSTPKHSTQALLNKKTHKAAIAALQEFVVEQVRDKKFGKLVKLKTFEEFADIPTDRVFMTDGNKKTKDGYEDYWCLSMSANTSHAPNLRIEGTAMSRRDDIDELEEVCHTGAVASVVGSLFMQDHATYGQRVNCNIVAVNFLNEDVELTIGGSVDDSDIWDEDEDDI